jgi:uncharacterized protein (TIGR02246 family)
MKVIALTAALAALAAPAFAGDHKAQIQGYADAWMQAYNAGDAAGVAKFYLDDARLSTAMGTVDGKPAIEQYFKGEIASGVKFQNITVDKAERFGEVNYSQGTFTATGPLGPATGHWLVVGRCASDDTCNHIQNHTANLALPVPLSAADLRAAMEANNKAWLAAFNTPNVAAFPAMYTDDAVLIPGGMAPAITGPTPISKFWEDAINGGFKDHTFDIVETRMDGNQAYLLSTWTVKKVKADGSAATLNGHTLRVLAKQADGSWKTKVHTFIPLQPQN